jgi:hypothetical protein
MEPWYKVVTPRKEVREGRSFNPDEFAIHLEQVVAKTAPEDYRDPSQFFSRTCFTRALREHAGVVLGRLAGRTFRALLKSETERGPDFLRLANALSALYPPGSDEKRLLDAMLLAVPR